MKTEENSQPEKTGNSAMKQKVASALLQKLGAIDTKNIHSVTVQIMMSGGDMLAKGKGENCPECGNKEENCKCDTGECPDCGKKECECDTGECDSEGEDDGEED